jgi:hypothetical protein
MARTTIIDCVVHWVLLHLQQICSRISLSGCRVELTKRGTNRPFYPHRPAVFAVSAGNYQRRTASSPQESWTSGASEPKEQRDNGRAAFSSPEPKLQK